MAKITIIDGNSLLFRAYYATAYGGQEIMRASDGTPTNAIFAFSNMINKIISSLKEGEGIFVAFDTGKHTFRHEALDQYKANRKPAPVELIAQFPLARDFLASMGIYQFEQDGFEGDDIAGTFAKNAAKEGYEVVIYTSDRDFLQLVDDKISINIIKKGLSDIATMTPSLVEETYGFKPLQIIDYKGLRGDSSDNLPGVPGIGEKTAVKLIQEYGSFDKIVEAASSMKGKVGENILEHQEIGRISRDLAIIKTDIDLPFSVSDTIYRGYDFKKVSEFCSKLELKQFINKVSPKWKFEGISEEINVEEVTSISSFLDKKPTEIGIALDISGDDYERDEVVGLALNICGKHLYIKIDDLKNDESALSLLKDNEVKKYTFDYKALKIALHNLGIEVNGLHFDLLIATYLIDSSLNTNADTVLALHGVNLPNKDDESSLFQEGNPQRTCQIALQCQMLYPKVKKDLEAIKAWNLYETLEIPLVNTLANMEIEGFPLDSKELDTFGDAFKLKEKVLKEEIYKMAGVEFNLLSSKQVADVLFNKLGLPSNKKNSTSIEVLKELQHLHPIITLLIEYRKYAKLISTYIEGLKPHIFKDGKIHAKFNQALTQTGRLSSKEPNLQNISIRDEEGKMIRKAFKYDTNEYEILSLDYSQIELRILASLSKCKTLMDIFESGEDIHAATAKKVFHLEGEPTDNQRRKAKAVNFGIIYGISDWGLAEQLEISPKEAKQIIDSFYQTFPEVGVFFNEIVANALKDGYVSTLLGRRRYLRELHDSNYQTREFAKRAAMNAPIQGTAADLIKIAMINVDKMLKENNFETKMVLQIHDELIFKVPVKEKDRVYPLIRNIMENALSLDVKLEVDGGFGKDWYSTK